MPKLLSPVQKSLYTELVKTAETYTLWATVEGAKLKHFRTKLLGTSLKAMRAGLPEEQIATALQIGEAQGRFEN